MGLIKGTDHGVRSIDGFFRRIGVLIGMEAFLESFFSFLELGPHHMDLLGAGLGVAQDATGLPVLPLLEPFTK